MEKDPLKKIEDLVQEMHDRTGEYTQPVLKRYPLLFAFLITLSVAAFLHGFEIWADQIELFEKHPFALMASGVIILALTGTLYKALNGAK